MQSETTSSTPHSFSRGLPVDRPYIGVQLLTLDQNTIPYVRHRHKIPLPEEINHGVLVAKVSAACEMEEPPLPLYHPLLSSYTSLLSLA